MLLARRYLISGRVQNVGFRFFTQAAAAREGLHGWVENRADGSVAIVAEGDQESLDRFERHVHRGPAGARVDRVDVEDIGATGHHGPFQIR
jgi:acylphosphatase